MVKNWRKAGAQQPVVKSIGESLERPGADLLFGDTDGLRDTVMLRLSDVVANPHQPRRHFDETELQGLASSMREVGQLSPVLVTPHPTEPKHFMLVAGERRWRAATMAGMSRIMAHILPVETNTEQIALIENLQRVDLSPVEEAEGIRRLIEAHEYNQEEVGDLLGRSRTEVNTTLTLLKLHPDIQRDCVTSHSDIPKAVLLEVARMEYPQQLTLWERARQGALTVREARDARLKPEVAKPVSEPKAMTPKRFIAGLGKLEKGLEQGVQALQNEGVKLSKADRQRLEAFRSRLLEYADLLESVGREG
ncbi:ParB/RepB/Spo0J family partition protein [Niveispirillum sp. SYP-B3756]|uniref:ParB/RepB/Spo0J family partition protein n=1 Tax=Niveispirillum sp. SYP-B3756 TaxID=2662178 RepID=UPI001290A183|nr:ParB/RepB/Spo0J family partition protein [Niveispirillum sp. SYP-B3756]MQP64658.1 ParB/RepB/Spo0J family partition protein [Niveispirillum sp. SYP-B3756]